MSENGIGNRAESAQKIVVEGRARAEITEVSGVLSFDEEEIVLETGTGRISVEGEGLRITVLSLETGVVSAVGKINGIVWLNESGKKRSGFLGRKG